IVNADKVVLTSNKADKKFAYHHSGYPGGLKATKYSSLMETEPEEVIRKAVVGMLPKGTLGRKMGSKLHVYRGATHPHSAQNPQPLEIKGARRERQAQKATA